MLDFRPNRHDFSQDIINTRVAEEKAKQSMLGRGLASAISGVGEGLKLSESIGNILERRQRRQRINEILESPEGKEMDAETRGAFGSALLSGQEATALNYMNDREKRKTEKPLEEEYMQSRIEENKSKTARREQETKIFNELVTLGYKGMVEKYKNEENVNMLLKKYLTLDQQIRALEGSGNKDKDIIDKIKDKALFGEISTDK